jgi:hypothetical protein
LQIVFNNKIKGMVQIFEMTAKENEKKSGEYWSYGRERDREEKQLLTSQTWSS